MGAIRRGSPAVPPRSRLGNLLIDKDLAVGKGLFTGLTGVLLGFVLGLPGVAAEPVGAPIVLTQVPAEAAAPQNWRPEHFVRADWFDGARVVVRTQRGRLRVLSEGFHSAADPDVACDGKRILFAGKKGPDSPWAIYEIGVDGGEARVIVERELDCRSPIYAGRLFTLNAAAPWQTIVFVGRNATLNEIGSGRSSNLYLVNLDGSECRRTTFNTGDDFDPFQTAEGRVLYAGWRYVTGGTAPPGRISLFDTNIDGTDHELYGATQGRRIQHMPCETPGGLVVFVESDSPAWDGAGQLASVRRRRPHHSYRGLTEPGEQVYSYPSPLDGNVVLVSRRPARGKANYGIWRLDADTGKTDVVFDTPEFHEVQATVVRARPLPDGRSTVVMPKFTTGILYGLNCYDTTLPMRSHLVPGSIKRLRVIEGVPSLPQQAGVQGEASPSRPGAGIPVPITGRRLLGEAPVEKDGSFNLEVPCDTPVALQLLDEQGMALATCRWTWVRPWEKRGCIGCHEDPERIPENEFVLALRRPSNRLTLPPERRRSVGFREHLVPIIQAKCSAADCHGGNKTPLRLADLDAQTGAGSRQAYEALLAAGSAGEGKTAPLGKYVDPGRARTSPLVWYLYGKKTTRPWDQERAEGTVKKMPPAEHVSLTEDEIRVFVEWIDLGAAWETPRL